MTDEIEDEAFAHAGLMLTAAAALCLLLAIAVGFPAGYVFGLVAVECIIASVSLIPMAEPESGFERQQGESNGRFWLRSWVTVHLLMVKSPVIVAGRTPAAVRRAVAWLRDTPEGDADA